MKIKGGGHIFALLLALLLAGCSAMDAKKETVEKADKAKRAPESTPYRSITNFSAALRCMDNQFLDYGVRDVSVIVEDIVDQTKKVNAGTKDMLISAVSDMTKRSRAIRLVAYGQDSGNLIGFLNQAGRKSAYAVIPQFGIKGSITQLDENLIRKQTEAGIGLDTYLNLGTARNVAASVLGLDLTMLSSEDLAVLPGVTARNSVIIFKEGKGIDGDATIKKFGVNYSMSLSKSEGQSQALRNLVELASIELFGKLTKTPYWKCLGQDSNSDVIKDEISDWYSSMYANPAELVGYFQQQMRARGFYKGAIDGTPNAELKDAVAKYRPTIGMSAEPKLNLEFFTNYLNAQHARPAVMAAAPSAPRPAEPSAPPAPAAAPAPAPAAAPAAPASAPTAPAPATPKAGAEQAPKQAAAAPSATERGALPSSSQIKPTGKALKLQVSAGAAGRKFKPGEALKLTVAPSLDAHVYCYIQDESRKIVRFYPNRFQRDSLVTAATPLQLPGNMRFQLVANDKGVKETVACFGAARDVAAELPSAVVGTDFEELPVASVEQVRDAFQKAAGDALGEGYLYVETD